MASEAAWGALKLVMLIFEKVQEMRTNREDLRQLAQLVRALKPLLEEVTRADERALPKETRPGLDILLACLRDFQELVESVAAMSGIVLLLKSGFIRDKVSGVRQGLTNSLVALQAISVALSAAIQQQLQGMQRRLNAMHVSARRCSLSSWCLD
jgi:hypothetical protein